MKDTRQTLVLISRSQIRKFLGVPVSKSPIRKFLWLIRHSQIRKFIQNTDTVSQRALKVVRKSQKRFGQQIRKVAQVQKVPKSK